jgi:zinc transporter ZupT
MQMNMKKSSTPENALSISAGTKLLLAFTPLLALGAVLAYIILTGAGLSELSGPPVEGLSIERIILPRPGMIQLEVVNDSPQTVIIAQVIVDEAYWNFKAEPSVSLPRLGRATLTVPYPWVHEEAHALTLITSLGATFEVEVPVAVEGPQPTISLFLRFGLVGIYVGVIPVSLGMLWFPLMQSLSQRWMNFILSLTVGLLFYLAVGTWLDAMEFARELPAFWQGVPLVVFTALFSLGTLLAIGNIRSRSGGVLNTAYLLAFGIGMHNLGEGLAIGAAFASGEAALGSFLVLGFTLHNITEGVGISAPLVQKPPKLTHFLALMGMAGVPAIVGTWIGGFAFNPVLATVFLGVGVGAILQVVWEVGKIVARVSESMGKPLVNPVNLAGFTTGIAIMYFTAFLVKF